MNKTLFALISIITIISSSHAEKEVRTCMFENNARFSANALLTCHEPNMPENITMKSLYKEGWELKTTYLPFQAGGTKYTEIHVDVVLVFEREIKPKK